MKSRHPPGGFREVLAIALPMVIGNSAFTVMQFCDRLFLAWYSDLAIQAAMPAGLLAFTLVCNSVFWSPGFGRPCSSGLPPWVSPCAGMAGGGAGFE